jgi:hypothetical protein
MKTKIANFRTAWLEGSLLKTEITAFVSRVMDIQLLLQNPKVLVGYDAEAV